MFMFNEISKANLATTNRKKKCSLNVRVAKQAVHSPGQLLEDQKEKCLQDIFL